MYLYCLANEIVAGSLNPIKEDNDDYGTGNLNQILHLSPKILKNNNIHSIRSESTSIYFAYVMKL